MPALTNLINYDFKKNMIFSPIKVETIPDGSLTFRRVNITTFLPDGSEGALIFKTPGEEHFCFGIKEFVDAKTKEVNGRAMGICIWSKDHQDKNGEKVSGPTPEEKAWSKKFEEMMDYCLDHLISIKEGLGMPKLTKEKIEDGFSPLFWSEDKSGKRVADKGPVLNAKVWETKGQIRTVFHEAYGTGKQKKTVPIADPAKTLLKTYCSVNAAFTLDSLYIGGYKRPQLKLYHVIARINSNGPQSILDMEEDEEEEPKDIAEQMTEAPAVRQEEEDVPNSDDDAVEEKPKRKVVRRRKQ